MFRVNLRSVMSLVKGVEGENLRFTRSERLKVRHSMPNVDDPFPRDALNQKLCMTRLHLCFEIALKLRLLIIVIIFVMGLLNAVFAHVTQRTNNISVGH